MLHTIAHYGATLASVCSGICVVLLLILAAAYIDTPAGRRKDLVWEIPAITTGLGVFWAAVAYGLHLL
jgi:hypothetical protein